MLAALARRFGFDTSITLLNTIRACVAVSLSLLAASAARADQRADQWRDAFQSSPADYDFVIPKGLNLPSAARERLRDRPPVTGTLRTRFALSVAGYRIRVRLSNEEGAEPLTINSACIGVAERDFDAKVGSLRRLTFSGRTSVTIPAGAPALSDSVDLKVDEMTEVVVSLQAAEGIKLKPFGGTLMAAAPGDQTCSAKLSASDGVIGRPIVSGALVLGGHAPRVLVALGDSITDGNRTSLNELRGWPEELERRLLASSLRGKLAVVNAGIGGNRVLSTSWGKSALARFDRDVARVTSVSHIIVLEGINDIGHGGKSVLLGDNPPLDVVDLIAGYRQIIVRSHARGIKVLIGTLTPFMGCTFFSPERESQRLAVNRWIRTSGEPDAVIDFDAGLRDRTNNARLDQRYDSGDHLHPNEAGYRAMANIIDLSMLDRRATPLPRHRAISAR